LIPAILLGRVAIDRQGVRPAPAFRGASPAVRSEIALFAVLVDTRTMTSARSYEPKGFLRKLFRPVADIAKLWMYCDSQYDLLPYGQEKRHGRQRRP